MIRRVSLLRKFRRRALPLAFLFALAGSAFSQTTPDNSSPKADPAKVVTDERAEQIVRRAIEAQGGSAYLNVKTIIAHGYFTPFAKGQSTLPLAFTDYLVFPDRERTEFRGQGSRSIQTNVADGGWSFDGATRALKDLPPVQVEDFRIAMRASSDNLLRGWWRKEGATLSYLGRREAGVGRRNEAVRLTYPDGFTVDYEIGAKDALPAKSLYKRKNTEGAELSEEDRFNSYKTIAGVTVPFILDHYRAGEQTSRVNYDSVEFNVPVAESLFSKPASVKAIK